MFPISELVTGLVLALAALAPFAPQQQADGQAASQEAEPAVKQEPAPQQPEIRIGKNQGNPNRGPTEMPAKRIGDIKDHRSGANGSPYVRRIEESRILDLSKVDFDAPIVATINGEDVTREEVRNWMAYTAGLTGIQNQQLNILLKQMVEEIIESGGDADNYVVTDEEIDNRIRKEEDDAREQGEEAFHQYVNQIESMVGMENYRTFVETDLLSEKCLLPRVDKEAGTMLPPESAELLSDQPPLRDYLAESYIAGNPLPDMFRDQFLKMLKVKLIESGDIRFAVDSDLPDGVFMSVNDVPVAIEEVLSLATTNRDDYERALRLLLMYRAVDAELAKTDHLLDDDEFDLAFAAHEAEYEGTIFPLRNMIQLRGFLSMSEFEQFFRRRAGFEQMLQETEQETLEDQYRKHHEQYGRLFYEAGKVSAEVIFTSAELSKQMLGEDATDQEGWEKAEERILSALAAVQSGEMSFTEARMKFGDPLSHLPTGIVYQKMRNELRTAFGETEYTIFTNGYSMCDDIFYNRVEEEVVGPFAQVVVPLTKERGGLGYMLVKVIEFRQLQPLKDFNAQKPLVMNDFADLRFLYFASECLNDADIKLFET